MHGIALRHQVHAMRTLELKTGHPELDEVLDLASSENVILTTPDGRRFVLAEIDDFEAEAPQGVCVWPVLSVQG